MKTYEILEGYDDTVLITETKEVVEEKRINLKMLKEKFLNAKKDINDAIDRYNKYIDLAQEITDITELEIPNLPSKLSNI